MSKIQSNDGGFLADLKRNETCHRIPHRGEGSGIDPTSPTLTNLLLKNTQGVKIIESVEMKIK
jgi:hypothetical protein